MEKNSSKPAPAEQPSIRHDPQPQTPPADTQMVAFKLGGSEEADLDNSDMENKDLDISNGESFERFKMNYIIYTLSDYINRHSSDITVRNAD